MPDGKQVSSEDMGRVVFFDTLRGLTILSMVAFHFSYDLAYIYSFSMPWFTEGHFQELWRCSISWTFLFLAGWMTSFSRSNLRRGAKYGAAAMVVYLATTIAAVDTPVNFGILFCMAASTIIFSLVQRFAKLSKFPLFWVALFLILFFATWDIPHQVFKVSGLAWLGFPSPTFSSGDYYPLIPFSFMYLAGAFAAREHESLCGNRYAHWMFRDWCPPLTICGRHSLVIYLLHQVLIIGILMLVLG